MAKDFDSRSAAELHIQDIYCNRSFAIEDHNGKPELVGLTYKQPIRAGVNVAQCAFNNHTDENPIPSVDCTCGWYAYDEKDLRWWGGASSDVDAIVRISGRTIVHQVGIRAAHIEIVALTANTASARYFIEKEFPNVPLYDDVEEMVEAHPITRISRGAPDINEHIQHSRKDKIKLTLKNLGSNFFVKEDLNPLQRGLLSIMFIFVGLTMFLVQPSMFSAISGIILSVVGALTGIRFGITYSLFGLVGKIFIRLLQFQFFVAGIIFSIGFIANHFSKNPNVYKIEIEKLLPSELLNNFVLIAGSAVISLLPLILIYFVLRNFFFNVSRPVSAPLAHGERKSSFDAKIL